MKPAAWRILTASILVATAAGASPTGAAPRAAGLAATSVTPVVAGVPTGASAVLANITMVAATASGYVTADRCSGLAPGPQQRSSGNHGVATAIANLTVVPVDADGRFCLFNQVPVELLADVQGYFAAAPDGQHFVPSAPTRRLDTRSASRPGGGTITAVDAGLAAGSSAALVNITMVGGSANGYISADQCSALTAGPQTRSSGNHGPNTAIANLSVVPLDADGRFCIFNQVPVDLVVDVQGSFAANAPGGLGLAPTTSRRVLDTRSVAGNRPPNGGITKVTTGLPQGSAAALVNITMVDGTGPGFITAGDCSTIAAVPQQQSNGNHPAHVAISNLSVVAIDAEGSFCIFNQTEVELVVDVQGGFAAGAAERFFPIPPKRVLDTRPPPSALPVTSCRSVVHIGDSTSVGLISPTYLADPAQRIDAHYRRVGVLDPLMEISGARSIVETLSGQINARDVAARWKAAGYQGCWVLALGTTDTANIAAGSGPGRRERIDRMMTVIGHDPVLWVNVRTAVGGSDPWSNTNMQLWNQALAAAAPSYPNLRIYDWAAAMNPVWLASDWIHYTTEGYAQRARLIADAVANEFPG